LAAEALVKVRIALAIFALLSNNLPHIIRGYLNSKIKDLSPSISVTLTAPGSSTSDLANILYQLFSPLVHLLKDSLFYYMAANLAQMPCSEGETWRYQLVWRRQPAILKPFPHQS
jgi:hypothetical protein